MNVFGRGAPPPAPTSGSVAVRRVAGPDRERGAAAVEFALVSILLLMLLLGTIAFGIGLFRWQSALHAAREGARLAAVGVSNCTAFKATVVDRGQGANLTAADVTMATTPDPSGTLGSANKVVVSVDYTIDLSLLGFIGFADINGTATGTARVETAGTVTSC